jgi:thioredoxin-related protein
MKKGDFAFRFMLVASIIALLFSCGGDEATTNPTTNSGIRWVGTSFVFDDEPQKKNYSFMLFYYDGCYYCNQFKAVTLADQEVIKILKESFNTTKINAFADSQVIFRDSSVSCNEFATDICGVKGYPTGLFFKDTGIYIGRFEGYVPPATFKLYLKAVLDGTFRTQ